jgi:integrase
MATERIHDRNEVLPSTGKYRCERRGKQGIITIFWLETREVNGVAKSREQSKSTRTADAAKVAELWPHLLLELEAPSNRKDMPVADVMTKHWENYAQHLESCDVNQTARDLVDDYQIYRRTEEGSFEFTCAGFDLAEQIRFIEWMRALRNETADHRCRDKTGRRYGDAAIIRYMNCIFAAMNDAALRKYIARDAVPVRVPRKYWKPRTKRREKVVHARDVAKLFDAAWDHWHGPVTVPEQRSSSWFQFMIFECAGPPRPEKALTVTAAQVDRTTGNLDFLPPDGEEHSNKTVQIIRMSPTVQHWVYGFEVPADRGQYIRHRGDPITNLKFFATLADKAGVDCTSYDLRHTLVTWLARFCQNIAQRKMMSAHKISRDSDNTYIHMGPDYCDEAVAAIELFFEEVSKYTKFPLALRDIQRAQEPIVSLTDQPEPFEWANEFTSPSCLVARQVLGKSLIDSLANQRLSESFTSLSGTEQS